LRALRKLTQEQAKAVVPVRQVERYIACPIGLELQQRLGEFLTDNPDLDEEAALALLLERGLRKTEDDRKTAVASGMRPFPKNPLDFSSIPESVTLDLDDRLRDRLEEFSVTHPGEIETSITTLIDVALDAVKKDPGVLDPARVIKREEPTRSHGHEKRAQELRVLLQRDR
jgi:hypothetical protein